eukprot:3669372-Prymnesium_polylepis.1
MSVWRGCACDRKRQIGATSARARAGRGPSRSRVGGVVSRPPPPAPEPRTLDSPSAEAPE